jgi:hypothetical protein
MSANVEIDTEKVTMKNSIVADGLYGFDGPLYGGINLVLKWVDVGGTSTETPWSPNLIIWTTSWRVPAG